MRKLFYSPKTWIKGQLAPATIEITSDIISAIYHGEKLPEAIDLGPNVLMPGIIDAHVHINEPGRTEWEGFETATRAAAKGGITMLVDMPLNSSPVVINIEAFQAKLEATKGKLHVNCGFWGGAIDGNTEATQSLIEKGCLGIKVFLSHSGLDEFPNISLEDLGQQMETLSALEVPILAHCEFDTLAADHQLDQFPQDYSEYLKSRPPAWENEAIKAFVALCEKHQCKSHIVHISSKNLLPWLQEQKEQLPLSVETCPHYLLFSAEEIEAGQTLFKCAPPIRNKSNNTGLKQALKAGIIDFIATDHSPAPANLKAIASGNFQQAWGGISSLQFLLPASWTALREELALNEFIPLLTEKPAHFLGFEGRMGFLQEGTQANLVVWNPDEQFLVESTEIEHKHKLSPYVGRNLFGAVKMTLVNGQIVYRDRKFEQLRVGKIILK